MNDNDDAYELSDDLCPEQSYRQQEITDRKKFVERLELYQQDRAASLI